MAKVKTKLTQSDLDLFNSAYNYHMSKQVALQLAQNTLQNAQTQFQQATNDAVAANGAFSHTQVFLSSKYEFILGSEIDPKTGVITRPDDDGTSE